MHTAFEWTNLLQTYRKVSVARSVCELLVTLIPFVAAWALMAVAVKVQMFWLMALLLMPTAGLMVRLFVIQHDCGHGSFFRWKKTNDWMGRLLALLTMIPYDYWKRNHASHHATSGNLARRGIGDIETLTVAEYAKLTAAGRLRYRFYRHPAVLFGLGPAYLILLKYRLPTESLASVRAWSSTMGTNLAILAAVGIVVWMVGPLSFVLVHLPVVLIAATIGVWLFYVQHQFDETHWATPDDWSVHEAALHGSSYYALPMILRWFTGNVGIHHVHHLSARIPHYRLPEVLRDFPELAAVGRVTLGESLRFARLALWDETRRCLVSFRDARREQRS